MLDRPDQDHDQRLSRHIVARAAHAKGGGKGRWKGDGACYMVRGSRSDVKGCACRCYSDNHHRRSFPTQHAHKQQGQEEADDDSDGDGLNEDGTVDRETRTLSQRLRRGAGRFLHEPIPLPLLRK